MYFPVKVPMSYYICLRKWTTDLLLVLFVFCVFCLLYVLEFLEKKSVRILDYWNECNKRMFSFGSYKVRYFKKQIFFILQSWYVWTRISIKTVQPKCWSFYFTKSQYLVVSFFVQSRFRLPCRCLRHSISYGIEKQVCYKTPSEYNIYFLRPDQLFQIFLRFRNVVAGYLFIISFLFLFLVTHTLY